MNIKRVVNYVMLLVVLTTGTFFMATYKAEAKVSVEPDIIRIGLAREVSQMQFSVQGNYVIMNGYNGDVITYAKQGGSYTLERVYGSGGNVRLSYNGQEMGTYSGPIIVEQANQEIAILTGSGALAKRTSSQGLTCIDGSGTITQLSQNISQLNMLSAQGTQETINSSNEELQLVTLYNNGVKKRYRGNLDLRPDDKGITIVNYLSLEDYLYGVVPSEMPSDWHHEALKAQAVVARTYALYSSGQYIDHGFDILATQASQVYNGYNHEAATTNQAVDETRGQVLTYGGRLVLSVFHSSSGGYVGNCNEIWVDDINYLRAKEDPYDYNNKHYNWLVSKDASELLDLFNAKGYRFSKIIDLEETQRDETNARLVKLTVVGLDDSGEIKREEIYNADRVRAVLGLKSSLFSMEKDYDDEGNLNLVTMRGSGWGHGLGLSQHGANGMALKGYNYQDILQYYYTGVNIEPNYGV